MPVVVQEITDDGDFKKVGRVEDGEIVDGADALESIDDAEVWEKSDPEELAARFDGPYVIAGIIDETESEAVSTKATPEGVPSDYQYVGPDEEPPDGHDVVESPAGATYVSPEPVGEGDEGGEAGADGQDDRPDPPNEQAEERGRAVEQAVGEILGPDPSNEEFAEAEAFLEDEVNVDDVDLSSLDAAQAERASRELGRMDSLGTLEGVESFRFSIPEDQRVTQGTLPAHYDRDGRGISVDPSALNAEAAERLNESGVTTTPRESHMMEHAEGQHAHAESVEEGNGEADGDESLEEAAEEAGVDFAEVASSVGELALAGTATFVAETYVMAKNGYPTPGQVGRLYRFLGGPTAGDLRGADGGEGE